MIQSCSYDQTLGRSDQETGPDPGVKRSATRDSMPGHLPALKLRRDMEAQQAFAYPKFSLTKLYIGFVTVRNPAEPAPPIKAPAVMPAAPATTAVTMSCGQ